MHRSRHVIAVFLGIIAVPGLALGWLGWLLVEQDRTLERQQLQERVDHAATIVAGGLERRLLEATERLPALAASSAADPPDGSVLVALEQGTTTARPASRLLYYPVIGRGPEPPANAFAAAEAAEFQARDSRKAEAAYRELARSGAPAVRAGALIRLARVLRKSGRSREALSVYSELARLEEVRVDDAPADLVARDALAELLAQSDPAAAQAGARRIAADLLAGRWQLDRASWHFYFDRTGAAVSADLPEREALAAAVERIYQQWREQPGQFSSGSRAHGWSAFFAAGRPVLVLWKAAPHSLTALVAGSSFVERQLASASAGHGVMVALTAPDGAAVLGAAPPRGIPQITRLAAETGLPWTLHVASAAPEAERGQMAARRRLLLAGLALVTLVLVAAAYLIARAFTREMRVARLQSDFVSAVSHEFRTPLTSMRHLTELLEEGAITAEERRREYFRVLRRESERLHRLVEGLLDFGRMESGKAEYRLEPLDASALAADVVREFQTEVRTSHRIEFVACDGGVWVRADHESLCRALWNLLDNAVKYSPGAGTVSVEVAQDNGSAAIRVRDSGMGIPAAELGAIFNKFTRGAGSKQAGIRGTGIGLTMVKRILQAHGGEVTVESAVGQGSTFTLRLPAIATPEPSAVAARVAAGSRT